MSNCMLQFCEFCDQTNNVGRDIDKCTNYWHIFNFFIEINTINFAGWILKLLDKLFISSF